MMTLSIRIHNFHGFLTFIGSGIKAAPPGQEGELNMITIKPLKTPHDIEVREHLEEALALAALKAREGRREYGLFCNGSDKPFASVNHLAWETLYGLLS
jgi:hypothetical protein